MFHVYADLCTFLQSFNQLFKTTLSYKVYKMITICKQQDDKEKGNLWKSKGKKNSNIIAE